MKNAKNRWAKQDGNFLIISVVCLILLGFLFVVIQDVLRRNSFEQELQKLADDTALYAAAMVPSVSVCSYITADTEIRPYMAAQNYGIGSHILSAADASQVDAYALQRAEEYVARAAMNSASSNYFGGNLVMTQVNPKFVAYRLASGQEIMDYYVRVELKTRWGGAWFGRGEDVVASAIAKATIDYKSTYVRSEVDPDSYIVDPIFAKGIYGKGDVELTNTGQMDNVMIVGDIHADLGQVKINYAVGDSISVYGTISGETNSVDAGAIDYTNGDSLWGDDNPVLVPPVMLKPDLTLLTAAQIAELNSGSPVVLSSADTNFNQPIIVWPGNYGNNADATGSFPPNYGAFIDPVTGNPYTGGTFYVYDDPGAGDGSLHLTGSGAAGGDPMITGNWTFVTDGSVHMNNLTGGIGSASSDNDLFFNVSGSILVNNATAPISIYGSFVADKIKIVNTRTNPGDPVFPFTIYGGMYAVGNPPSSGYVDVGNTPSGFTLIYNPAPNAIPPQFKYPLIVVRTPPNYSSPRVILIH